MPICTRTARRIRSGAPSAGGQFEACRLRATHGCSDPGMERNHLIEPGSEMQGVARLATLQLVNDGKLACQRTGSPGCHH